MHWLKILSVTCITQRVDDVLDQDVLYNNVRGSLAYRCRQAFVSAHGFRRRGGADDFPGQVPHYELELQGTFASSK